MDITLRRVSWVFRVLDDFDVITDLLVGEREGERVGEERECLRSREVRMELDLERMESASFLHLFVGEAAFS